MVRRKAPTRKKPEKKPTVLYRFRKNRPVLGECDSTYCQGFSTAYARQTHCMKCKNVLHLDCLGIVYKNQPLSRFVCSGCRTNDKNSLTKQRYVWLCRKLRRHYTYVKMIAFGNFGSWRRRDYWRGGLKRRNLWYCSSVSFVDDDEVDSMLETFISWLADWKLFHDCSDNVKFSLDVLLPEALIRVIMDVENVHRDHAEYMFLRSRIL